MIDLSIEPFLEALQALSRKTATGSALRTAEWRDVPLQLRERAFFSAGVENVNLLQLMKSKLRSALALDPERAFLDKQSFVLEMRDAMHAGPDTGRLTDITSSRRLELIHDFQKEDLFSGGRWKIGQDEDLLDEFPCQEFLRVESRRQERQDWPRRWHDAGGSFYQGRMIARKDDPVWKELSVFGKPWPPFDFGSGMGVQDIDRDEAVALGVIQDEDVVKPTDVDFNEELQASVRNLDTESLERLKQQFGDQIEIDGDTVKWRGQPAA